MVPILSRGPARPGRVSQCRSGQTLHTTWLPRRNCHLLTRLIHSRMVKMGSNGDRDMNEQRRNIWVDPFFVTPTSHRNNE